MTTAKAASNGSTTTTPASKPERSTGYAQVREAEAYHASSVMHDAVFEAERLCDAINRLVSDAYFGRNDGRSTVETAESFEVRDKATEALRCLRTAEDYLYRLAPERSEPLF